MNVKIYAVYDSKSESYGQLFTCKTTGEALRGFEQAANDKNTKVGKWPEDHTIFELGEYNERTGEIKTLPTQVSHGLAIHYVKSTPPAIMPGGIREVKEQERATH